MKHVIPTIAFALVNDSGILLGDADGRALIYATEEQATAALLADHPGPEILSLSVVSVNPPEYEE